MLQAQKGKPRVIAPHDIAEASIQYPVQPFEAR